MRGSEPGAAWHSGGRGENASGTGSADSSTPAGCGTQAAADLATIEAARAALGLDATA